MEAPVAADHQLWLALGQTDHARAVRAQSGHQGNAVVGYGQAELRSARGRGIRPLRERPHRAAGWIRHLLRTHSERDHCVRLTEYRPDRSVKSTSGAHAAANGPERTGISECF